MNLILLAIGIPLFILLVGIPWILGVTDMYMANRFAKNHGTDRTAAFTNWMAFKWSWLNQLDHIVKLIPFMGKDLTEIYGIKPDDGRIT